MATNEETQPGTAAPSVRGGSRKASRGAEGEAASPAAARGGSRSASRSRSGASRSASGASRSTSGASRSASGASRSTSRASRSTSRASRPASRPGEPTVTGRTEAAIRDGMTSGFAGVAGRLASVGHGIRELRDDVREQVAANPMRSAGIALGAGLAAGFLARHLLD